MISGRLHMHALALSPLHHGGETSGNTTLVRRQEIVDPETGELERVPFISGNSFKHLIREHGARFALEAAGFEADFTKEQRDLLISGGTFSSGGNSVDLEAARTLETAFPILAVCGYAAGNRGAASKLNVDHLQMICRENRWRVYDRLEREVEAESRVGQMVAEATGRRAPALLDEEFGTRQEPNNPNVQKLLSTEERAAVEAETAEKQGQDHPDKGRSQQMIYDYEVVKPGAQFQGCVYYRELTDMEWSALAGAFYHAAEDTLPDGRQTYRVGGRSSVGLGKLGVQFFGSLREDIRPPEHVDADALVEWGEGDDAMESYVEHLREHRGEIIEAMEALL